MKTLSDYQSIIDTFLEEQQYEPKYWSPHENLARLIEELGEVGRILNREFGPKPPKPGEDISHLQEELGDILIALICLANSQNIDLSKGIEQGIAKMMHRDIDRFPRKGG
ncbi:TPA: nucleotide pyrophosphohydrolase [Candidatus Saccharibacteria bacterium]|nr:nucleotide pyrophosphohydrolase [Candidatus Saccharibacteria bacterium]HIO87939.1 nucleotide pyrophosphohydrolase [Candidatus Saccharibacteria bacterium]